jgi:hypothetical protein
MKTNDKNILSVLVSQSAEIDGYRLNCPRVRVTNTSLMSHEIGIRKTHGEVCSSEDTVFRILIKEKLVLVTLNIIPEHVWLIDT